MEVHIKIFQQNRLENICLLERGWHEMSKCVKMHDLVRDMAIKVASVIPHRFLVKAGMQLEDIPKYREKNKNGRLGAT
ncbi:hypothetical protein L484_019732 [Morus notabilis]|uniref:Uncharacterized protein n=1 Tax=Morus notabilis TaxID=981085 RepID=W9QDG8_9ROSA|nr:hypothetical protein L484_019732 [Morus notabilis]